MGVFGVSLYLKRFYIIWTVMAHVSICISAFQMCNPISSDDEYGFVVHAT